MNDIEQFLIERDYSPDTIESYRRAIKRANKALDFNKLQPVKLKIYLDSHGWGSSHRWNNYCAIRAFLKWKYGEQHPALKLKIKRREAPPQRFLKMDQVKQLFASFNTGVSKGRRDLAMASLMLDTGLRVSEICRLEIKHTALDDCELFVIVKGGRWDQRTYSIYTANNLAAWLADRETIAAPIVKTIFVSVGGKTRGQKMTRDGVKTIVRYWGEKIGIKLSPHDFRRSMATLATQQGAPEDVIMKAGGWKNHETLRRYTIGVTQRDMLRYFPTSAAMET